MRLITNLLRFIIYLPLCLGLLFVIYWSIGQLTTWLIGLKIVWLIVFLFFGTSLILAGGMYLFGFLAAILSYINPYKKVGGWIVIPIAIIIAIFHTYLLWKVINLNQSKELIIGLIMSALTAYITLAFSITISAKNPKELIAGD